jgi:uncharacterized membrane protein
VTPERRRRAVAACTVALSLACAVLAHVAIVRGRSPLLGAWLALLPIAVFAAVALRRRTIRAATWAWAAAALALAALLLWLEWGALERHFPRVFFLEHLGANLALAVAFGRTLRDGADPMCTRFARALHGALPPEVERYTRRVTIAWSAYFSAIAALSAALYLGGYLAAWSLLANILNPILVALMFAIEYAVRLRVLPHWERTGILGAWRAYSRHLGAARVVAPR